LSCVAHNVSSYLYSAGPRRALLRHFPYALIFVIEADETLVVIACFHGSRDPALWQQRT
jgi:hypothetical protein